MEQRCLACFAEIERDPKWPGKGCYVAKLRWRRVHEAVPDCGVLVLLAFNRHERAEMDQGWFSQGRWYARGGERCWPTHWMPLPLHPSETKEQEAA